jgi:hypothetical protein
LDWYEVEPPSPTVSFQNEKKEKGVRHTIEKGEEKEVYSIGCGYKEG